MVTTVKDNNHINNKLKTADIIVYAVFLIAELTFYLAFMWTDWVSSVDTTAIKFVAIVGCLFLALYNVSRFKTDGKILFFAMLFTVCSDLVTLVINDYFTLGVSLFIPAQLLYALRMRFWAEKPLYKPIIVRFTVILTTIISLAFANAFDGLTVVTGVYFSMLIFNAVESIFFAKSPKKIAFCIGLWLFVLCDVCVGLYNLPDLFEVTISPRFHYAVSVLMWGFYLPSQVLIVLSALKEDHPKLSLWEK